MNAETLSGFRLSPGQDRLWRLTAAGALPENLAVRARFAWTGRAPDRSAVADALTHLVRRHEILRTGFHSLPEMDVPLQAALDPGSVSLNGSPADLHPGRAQLCAFMDTDGLTLALPSLCGDGPTLLRLAKEVAAILSGDRGAGGEEPLQYFDLAEWQHELLSSTEAGGPHYWSGADLQAVNEPLPPLPALRSRIKAQFRPARVQCPLPNGTADRLDAVCARLEVTRVDMLAALWTALLWRLSEETALPVALVADGRPYEELADALGPLAGPVPIPLQIAEGMRFAELARMIAGVLPAARERRHHLVPPADGSFVPFPLELSIASFEAANLFRLVELDAPSERFLLKLSALSAADGGLTVMLDYDAGATVEGGAARMSEQFATLLAAVLEAPDTKLDDPDIVGPQERRLLTEAFQGPVVPALTPWRPVHLAIADLARTDPARLAVVEGDITLTASELDAHVAVLAGRLREAGVAAETPVALYLPRGQALATSILAVLRSGGAYLPLSPELPSERVRFVLADSGVRHVVSLPELVPELPADMGLELILMGGAGGSRAPEGCGADKFPVPTPDQAVYILYTSGSTGQPKGVVVTHGSLANHMAWMNRALPLTPRDAVLQKTAAGFDASVWEFFAPLMQGAKLVIAPPGLERDVPALIERLQRDRITVLQVVPSLLSVLVDEPEFAACTGLRRICCGGEALSPDLVRRLKSVHSADLVNLYGPTETTIQICADVVTGDEDRVSIGRPIDNVRIHVVDARDRPVPIGMRGEILIGGAALARGYLNRPDLTAERFIDDPVIPGAGRVYRTGDFGAWRPDGRLDFFGRKDHQVKLRGYRVELGEVEATAARHPAVANVAALVEPDANGIDRLLCCYTCRPGQEVEPATLRAWLGHALPDYMVPGQCRRLDKLPLNASGKVDRKLLAQLATAQPVADGQAPRDPTELRLERVWEAVLDVHPVGIDRTFFDLGGHSLLAVRLMAEVRREFGCDLPLVSLFQAPTVADQAALIRSQRPTDPVVVPITRGLEGEQPVFLVHPTGGSVLCYRDLARRLGPTRPIYALQDPGLEATADYESVEELAAFYIDRIRPFGGKGPYYLAGWSSGGIVAFEMAHQLVSRGEEVGLVALVDSVAVDADESEIEAGPPEEGALIQSVARLLAYNAGVVPPDLADLDPAGGMEKLRELAISAGFLPPDASPDYIRRVFDVFRRNVEVVRRYRPGPFPRRILLLKATEPLPEAVRGAAARQRSDDPDLGWGRVSAVSRREIPAHHLSIVEEPAVAMVGAEIRNALDEADRLRRMGDRVFFTLLGH